MAKVSFYEMASVLVEHNGIDPEVAREFVKTIFDIVQEHLPLEQQVKIKGLGTFKIVDVDARESINVNTGARILIEGHSKVTFTPDSAMKELINKPFSQFETVVLNDGVNFEDAGDDEAAGDTVANMATGAVEVTEAVEEEQPVVEPTVEPVVEQPVVEQPVVEQPEERPFVVDEPLAVAEPVKEEPIVDETIKEEPLVEEPVAEEPLVEEPAVESPVVEEPELIKEALVVEEPAVEEPVVEQSAVESPVVEESVPTPLTSPTIPTSPTSPLPPEQESPEEEIEEEESDESSHTKSLLLHIIYIIVIAAASAFGGYWYGVNSAMRNNCLMAEQAAKPKVVVVKKNPVQPVAKKDSVHNNVEATQNNVEATQNNAEATQQKTAETVRKDAQKEAPKAETKPSEETINNKYAKMDARVRTGAYYIVGEDFTVTVKKGESVTHLAKRTLGEGMECYIEVFNGISGNTSLKEGQKIKIPKLKLKKKTGKK